MSKQIVIVGASRGIGLELVKFFAKDASNSILALSRKIPKDSCVDLPNVSFQAFDLNDSKVREQAEVLFDDINQIDVLVNNAGLLVNKPFLELTHADLQASYQTNIIGVMQTVQAAVPKMIENGGHIVNISSMGGFQGSVKFAGLSTYSTSKAALVSFTELFAEEFKDTKIKTNCLCLGAVQTEMLAEAFPGYEAPLTAEQMAGYIGDFSENAHRFMNGKIIPVSLSTP